MDTDRLWTGAGNLQDVLAWVQNHPPIGSSGISGTGTESRYGVVEESSLGFTYPISSAAIQSEQVLITVAPLAAGQVGIRADAQVIWYPTRPPTETIPSGARTVVVEVSGGTNVGAAPTVIALRTLANPAVVSQLATKIDALPLQVPGTRSCPAAFESSPRLTLVFTGPPAVPAAEVVDDTSGCGGVTLTTGHDQGLTMVDDGLFHMVDTIIGISLPNIDTTP